MAEVRRVYTLDEANALLPEVRAVLLQLAVEKARLESAVEALTAHGADGTSNGDIAHADALARSEAEMTEISGGMRALVEHLESLDVELRDLEEGLVDFPGERDGRPVWLCWRLAEPAVAHWHPVDQGFANRQPW
ncbi:MAG TPA: DUF2203 domain-containing protein [Candidatus Limnocylindria bacterium]|jgi:hypothetical protein